MLTDATTSANKIKINTTACAAVTLLSLLNLALQG